MNSWFGGPGARGPGRACAMLVPVSEGSPKIKWKCTYKIMASAAKMDAAFNCAPQAKHTRTVSLSVPSNTKTYSDFSKLIARIQEVGGTHGSAQIMMRGAIS